VLAEPKLIQAEKLLPCKTQSKTQMQKSEGLSARMFGAHDGLAFLDLEAE
jgi:hypothetical protein